MTNRSTALPWGHADVLLAMTQLACDAYASDLAENGTLVVDSGLVQRVPERKNIFRIPLTALAKEASGKEIAANVVALGALAVLGNIASPESVRAAMHARFPEKLREANDRALRRRACLPRGRRWRRETHERS